MTRQEFIAGLLKDILRREGWPKVTNKVNDRGQLTKGGVTYANYGRWRAKKGLSPITLEQFNQITEADALAFFEDEFLRPFGFITDDRLFEALSDWSVNAGPDDPARALQKELQVAGAYAAAIDGIVGPKTRAAWDVVKDDADTIARFRRRLHDARREFHFSRAFDAEVQAFLIAHPRSQLWNLLGWIRRTDEFL